MNRKKICGGIASLTRSFLILFLALHGALYALEPGDDVHALAMHYYDSRDYRSAATECMRYQYLFPAGNFYGDSMCLLARAWYRQGDYTRSRRVLELCRDRSGDDPSSSEALYLQGYVNLLAGADGLALLNLKQYKDEYPEGKRGPETLYLLSCAKALRNDFAGSLGDIRSYNSLYGSDDDIMVLEKMVEAEKSRPLKRRLVAALGSVVVPGFGYFYTGRYAMGFLAFATNCLCSGLIYHGYRNDNIYEMVLFSVLELSFYQYSIYGGVRSVHEYNSREKFRREIRLGFSEKF